MPVTEFLGNVLTGIVIFTIVSNIAIAIIASIAAEVRGQNGLAWFLAALFFGAIILISMFLFPVNQDLLDGRKVRLNEMKWCQACRRAIHIEATKCCYCHSRVEAEKQEA